MAPQTETRNATLADFRGPLAQIHKQLGPLSADQLQSVGSSGLLSDLANCPDPRNVHRGTLQRVLAGERAVLSGALPIGGLTIEPPPGGRIHLLGNLPVDESRDFANCVRAAGPNTDKSSDIHKVGKLWTPEGDDASTDPKVPRIITAPTLLVNFGQGVYPKIDGVVAEWVRTYPILQPISARRCLAIAEYRPLLHREVGMDSMGVASTDSRLFAGQDRVVDAWWRGSKRVARLACRGDEWRDDDWFGFACGSPLAL